MKLSLLSNKEEIAMKKYTKPMVEVVELTVKESLSTLPARFNTDKFKLTAMGKFGTGVKNKNVTVYTANSATPTNG